MQINSIFDGKELVIRSATRSDALILLDWWNDGKIMAHAGFPLGLNTTIEKVQSNIEKNSDTFQLLILEFNNQPIGEMNYTLEGNVADFGIKICVDSFQEKGLGTYSLQLLIDYLFNKIGCDKVICDTNLKNIRAQYVYENKLKMKKTKILYDSWKNQLGELQSTVFFELENPNKK